MAAAAVTSHMGKFWQQKCYSLQISAGGMGPQRRESATASARRFRDYIRLFRAVEHEGWIGDGRTRRDADHSRDTQHNMIEGANESRKDL